MVLPFNVDFGKGINGVQGIIVVTITPATSTVITAGSPSAMEYQAVSGNESVEALEFGRSVLAEGGPPIEARRCVLRVEEVAIESCSVAVRGSGIPLQTSGSLALIVILTMPCELGGLVQRDTLGISESVSVMSRQASARAEWITIGGIGMTAPVEHALQLEADYELPFEIRLLLADGTRISAGELLYLEWADPPSAPVLVTERLLRSPGRVRILARPGRTHQLRVL